MQRQRKVLREIEQQPHERDIEENFFKETSKKGGSSKQASRKQQYPKLVFDCAEQ